MERNQIVNTLNDLIETCHDGEYGFNACAEHAGSVQVRELFRARALDCVNAARELQDMVQQHGGSPDEGGTARGALQRGWVAVLGTLGGNSDKHMLEAAERGEDSALASYRKALRSDGLPPNVRALIERQMVGVQRNHDQIRHLRDLARAEA
jgi:uncharacterized protein (TIGR02284 family)